MIKQRSSLSLCLSIKKFSKTSPLFTFLYIAHPKHSNIRYTHKQEQKKIEGWDCQFVGNRWLKKRIEDNATRGKCNWTSWNTFCVCSENVMVFTVCWTAAWHVTDGRKSGKNGTRSRFAHLSVKGGGGEPKKMKRFCQGNAVGGSFHHYARYPFSLRAFKFRRFPEEITKTTSIHSLHIV